MRKILIPLVLIASALLSGCASIGSGSGRSSWWPDLSASDYFLWAAALAGAALLVAGLLVSSSKLIRRPLHYKPQRPLAKLGLRYAALAGVFVAWLAVFVMGSDEVASTWLAWAAPARPILVLALILAAAISVLATVALISRIVASRLRSKDDESAKIEAEAAKVEVEAAKLEAEAVRIKAEAARIDTDAARDAAEAARTAANAARTAADAAKVNADRRRRRANGLRGAALFVLGFGAALVIYPTAWSVFWAVSPAASAVTYVLIGGGIGLTAWGIWQQFAVASEEQAKSDVAEEKKKQFQAQEVAERQKAAAIRAAEEEQRRLDAERREAEIAATLLAQAELEVDEARGKFAAAEATLKIRERRLEKIQQAAAAQAQGQPQSTPSSKASVPSPVQKSRQATSKKGGTAGPLPAPAQTAQGPTSPKTMKQLARESMEELPRVEEGNGATSDQTPGATTASETSPTPPAGPDSEAGKGPPTTS